MGDQTNNPNVWKAEDFADYDFGDPTPPEGFDPNASGFEFPPVGEHEFELINFELEVNKAFNGQDFGTWTGNQLRTRMRVPAGQPHAGATIFDYIPLPTPGAVAMPKVLANRWSNFARSLGVPIPANALVPPGFKLHDLLNGNPPGAEPPAKPWRRCRAEVIDDEYQGKTKRKIKFFGYKPVGNGANGNGPSGVVRRTGPQTAAATATPQTAAAATSPGALNLDDL